MTVEASSTLTIDALPELVIETVRDVAGQVRWWPGMREAEVLAVDEEGRATRARLCSDVKVAVDTYEVEFVPTDDGMTFELAAPSKAQKHMSGSWVIVPLSEGTEVTLSLTIDTTLMLPRFVQERVVRETVVAAVSGLRAHLTD